MLPQRATLTDIPFSAESWLTCVDTIACGAALFVFGEGSPVQRREIESKKGLTTSARKESQSGCVGVTLTADLIDSTV